MPDEPETPGDWAELLKNDWERRSRSPSRDFFVASHPGWDDPERWDAQAKVTVDSILLGYPRERLPGQDVLEIGCGVGRLGTQLHGEVNSYTGVDISAGMIAEARQRCRELEGMRFFESDGLRVPDAARDRAYALILAMAVFIHCPREMTATLISDAYTLLAPGGQLRLQVRGDIADPTGVQCPDVAEQAHRESQETEDMITEVEAELIEDTPYMGHEFGYEELRTLLGEVTQGTIDLLRTDLLNIYASVEKPTDGTP